VGQGKRATFSWKITHITKLFFQAHPQLPPNRTHKQDRKCTYNANTVSCLRNHCCKGNATILSLRTVVDLHVAVNTIKPLSTALETLEWVPFALLSAYKIFSIAVSNINVLSPHAKYPACLSDFNQIWSWSTHFRPSPKYHFHGNPSTGSRADTYGQTWRSQQTPFAIYANAPKKKKLRIQTWLCWLPEQPTAVYTRLRWTFVTSHTPPPPSHPPTQTKTSVWPATNSNSKLVITIIFSFLARSQSFEKRVLAVSRLSVRPQWKNSAPTTRILMKFDMSFFRKPVVNIPLKPDQNNGYLTQGPMHTYDNISLNSS
jgi:hypothetical protein